MSRMNGPKRKKRYELLARKEGEYCFIGGEPGTKVSLVIDHADNNNANNKRSNLHLICRSMNSAKNPRGSSKRKRSSACVSVNNDASGSEPVQVSAELKKNLQAEPDFRHWLFIEIWRKGRLSLIEVINCGAAIARCSQSAIRRYLDKESSRVRIYVIVEDPETKERFVQFRPYWERCRKLEERRMKLVHQAENWIKERSDELKARDKEQKMGRGVESDEQAGIGSSESPTRPP